MIYSIFKKQSYLCSLKRETMSKPVAIHTPIVNIVVSIYHFVFKGNRT